MANKKIAYCAVSYGVDGREKKSILYASFDEDELNVLHNKDKSKNFREVEEEIVDVDEARKEALAKLDGIDRLVLGLPNWLEDKDY